MLSAIQIANAKAAIIAAETQAGNPNYTPSMADILLFANDPANSASVLSNEFAPGTPALDAATITADINAMAAEATANKNDLATFASQIITYLAPIITKLV